MDNPGVVPGPASKADAVLDADRAVDMGTHLDADVATDVEAERCKCRCKCSCGCQCGCRSMGSATCKPR
eukprot:scaffold82577_cov25-Attheya_sp.AAC.1